MIIYSWDGGNVCRGGYVLVRAERVKKYNSEIRNVHLTGYAIKYDYKIVTDVASKLCRKIRHFINQLIPYMDGNVLTDLAIHS